jgi:hypothetical protein
LQGGLNYERELSEQDSVRVLGYFGDREVEQFLANPSDAITGSGGVVDLDRKFGRHGVAVESRRDPRPAHRTSSRWVPSTIG